MPSDETLSQMPPQIRARPVARRRRRIRGTHSPSGYPFKVPGRPLTEADYRKAAQDGGFTGTIIVGTDLASLRLPAK